MAIIRNGANGGFSGKAGSVIGSSWNGIDYIKGLPKISKKQATQEQLDQRAKFATVVTFLSPIQEILKIGWNGRSTGRTTPVNMAVQYALTHAVTGSYPDYAVDPAEVLISKGTLGKAAGVTLATSAPAALHVSWHYSADDKITHADDQLVALVYNPEQNVFLSFVNTATRSEMEKTFSLPPDFAGQQVHVYLFFVRRDHAKRSESTYAGAILIS